MTNYDEKLAAKRARFLSLAASATARSSQAHAGVRAIASRIEPGQPILVGHHSEGRHRRDIKRMDAGMRASIDAANQADEYARRAAAVGTAGVSSDDPAAIDKLKRKAEALEADQAQMKAANQAIRSKAKAGPEAQRSALVALGFSEEAAAGLLAPDFCKRIGFPAYRLSNNNAEIRRVRERIAALEAARSRAPVTLETSGYVYREDISDNRVLFEFPDKPSAEVRKLLRDHAFRWSPTRGESGAWVRFLNNAGRYAAATIRDRLDAMRSEIETNAPAVTS